MTAATPTEAVDVTGAVLVQTNEGRWKSAYWWTELYRLADGWWYTRETCPTGAVRGGELHARRPRI